MGTPEVLIAARSSNGIKVTHGVPTFCRHESFEPYISKNCKAMCFSKDGKLLSWCDTDEVIIIDFPSCVEKARVPKSGISHAAFSPQGNCLALWQPYTVLKDSQHGNPNLHIWDVKKGIFLHSFIQKKQSTWKPQWTDNDDICARSVNNEVHFFEKNNFETIGKKMYVVKVAAFSLAPGPPPYHVVTYVPGIKGQPSSAALYKYPNFEGSQSVIARRNFYKADKVEFYWNDAGDGLVILCSTDVDKTGASYYGEQLLYYMSTQGGDTKKISLLKDGPIYSVAWSPTNVEFCVVYGFMPAKGTIFNKECEPVFDFGTGPRNAVHYNPHGNILILAGFGNLRGNVEVWDINGRKLITKIIATDSTFLSWNPDGQHIMTATTSPRLRIGNGYKIWHYSGSLLHEMLEEINTELFDIEWQPFPKNAFPQRTISLQQVPGIISSQPVASKEVYRPPGARGLPSKIKLHDEDYEAPSNMKNTEEANLSKTALKNKKKKEAKKAKKEQEKESLNEVEIVQPVSSTPAAYATLVADDDDPEKMKKIRNITKKLDQISKLKEEQQAGKVLEINQLQKIRKEKELLDELTALHL